jgi:hypothetical protein
MNSPVRTRPIATWNAEASLDELIDLLADDALDAPRRAALLRSFDAQPETGGWRRCALALLEAQAWRRAMAQMPEGSRAAESGEAEGDRHRPRRASIFPRLAVAAVIAAFAAGLLLGQGGWRRIGPTQQVTQGGDSSMPRPSEAPDGQGLIAHQGGGGGGATGGGVRQVALPDYVRRQLEREGYEVQGGGSKLIPVSLPDGRRVNVPVETLRYQYVGKRVR